MTNNSRIDQIPLVDLKAQYATIRAEIAAAIDDVLINTRFMDGEGKAFLPAFAKYVGCEFAVGCNSGTDALILALKALQVGPGDEVIMQANTFIATAEAATAVGAKPVFVDVREDTGGIDAAAVEAAISDRTKAIMPVHLFGMPADMDEIMEIADRRGVAVVEDCAQSHGALYKGKPTGSFGVMGCFSFYPGKNLGAYGDGGAITMSDTGLADLLKRWRDHGSIKKYVHDFPGLNSRLDGIQVAVLGVKLRHLDDWNAARRRIAARYVELLDGIGDLRFFSEPDDRESVYHLFEIRSDRRDELLHHLHEHKVWAGLHYPDPVHLTEAYRGDEYPEGSLPVCEMLAREIISLPIYPELTEAQQDRVAEVIENFFA